MANLNLPALCSIEEFLSHDYDFIVVGGGTAGLTVAARLTENPKIKVGVLEAGAANINDPMILTPALYPKIIGDPKYDWVHHSVPQKHLTNKIPFQQPRGKGLGGSSAINYQIYVRGHASEYDDWEKLGNKGWSFTSLLPYFKKHETFDPPTTYKNPSNIPLETQYSLDSHGHNGPIHTSFATWRFPQEREWMAASATLGEKMGMPVGDAWSGDHLGTFHSLSTVDRSGGAMDGTRSYAVTGYLIPNAERGNLRVLTEALVERLVVEEHGGVTGIEFQFRGEKYKVEVKKEIVLCAGVIKTPQILELSGIGNPSILTAAGIKPLVTNLRIGENFHDHPATGFGYELVDGQHSLDAMQDPSYVQAAMVEYASTRGGPLSSGGSAMSFVSYASLSTPSEISDLQQLILSPEYDQPGHTHTTEAKQLIAEGIASNSEAAIQLVLLPASLNITSAHNQTQLFAPPPAMVGKQGVVLAVCLSRPLSVGSVHITSNDPKEDPAIDPAYLSHPADVEVLRKGLELVERMVDTSPFREVIKRRYHPSDEGEGGLDMNDKQAVEAWLRGNIATQYHPIGTCSMGVEGVGAVDERLLVRGCKVLRVVDASVIPLHVSGNIVATVYAIAEKGADLIKEDWGL